MARVGNFIGRLYTDWGTRRPKRNTESRNEIEDEAYISIAQKDARRLDIFMSNKVGANTEYEAYDKHWNFIGTLKAQGNTGAGSVYAKQFAHTGNLKGLKSFIVNNDLFDDIEIEVEVLDNNELILTPLF